MTYAERLHTALVAQHAAWFDYSSQSIKAEYAEKIDCPACGSARHATEFVKDMFHFERCADCAMIFLSPRLNVPATYAFYNSEWTGIYNETKFLEEPDPNSIDSQINKANLDLIIRHLSGQAKGKLLEVGFGGGHFLHIAHKAGFEVFGVDVDSENCRRAQADFGDHIVNADLFAAGFPDNSFDVVYLRDVFEHVPNPRQLLVEFQRVLKEGGLLFIEVPNMDGLIYKAVHERHICVFGFAHLNYWNPKSISEALAATGFKIMTIAHDSLDCTIAEMCRYILTPSFTTVFPRQENPRAIRLAKIARTVLSLRVLGRPVLGRLDHFITPKIADWIKQGSVIRVMSKKAAAS